MSKDKNRNKELFLRYISNKPLRDTQHDREELSEGGGDDDRKLFESYIESHAVVPKQEEVPKDHHDERLGKRKRKQIHVRETIDLHGMISVTAEQALRSFLAYAQKHAISPVCIIHGKGIHSDGIGVIKKLVKDFLSHEGARYVQESRIAPRQYGGSGATIVWIRRR